jgi:DNA (cytosine-5)-methyltransferase 1
MTLPIKPAYRIPSVAEIMAIPDNGLKVASTFSGCGGSCLGFRWAGFRHVYANEFIPAARETYLSNFVGATYLDDRDIRKVTVDDVLKSSGMKPGELDVFEGSPPCSSFSASGKGAKGWGEVKAYSNSKQRTDDLFFEYIRLLKGLQPKMFVAENVAGLVRGAAIGTFIEIINEMNAAGYVTKCRILDAQWLGVPQVRRRTIFIGIRNDLVARGVEATYPTPLPYQYTIADAIPWIRGVRHESMGLEGNTEWDVNREPIGTLRAAGGGAQMRYYVTDNQVGLVRAGSPGHGAGNNYPASGPAPTIMAGGIGGGNTSQMKVVDSTSIEKYAIGKEWAKLKEGQGSDKYLNLVRSHRDEPCPTITQRTGSSLSTAGVTHPTEPRKFTIAELRRLGGFPDDFTLTGSYSQQWERIGRAVPPPMMAAVAREVAKTLLGLK